MHTRPNDPAAQGMRARPGLRRGRKAGRAAGRGERRAPKRVSSQSCAVSAVSGVCSRHAWHKLSYRTYSGFRPVRRACVPGAVGGVRDLEDIPG
ncbi:hypothetical protein Sdia_25690 [Streptomyces diastaticus subsp. diastaticus]|uniref:Membrane protein insertion efficiency factor YidD n=1 Tax=Streptomyces diastaticus subsp. diastaticus TaxID=68040 RepID=A0ABQ1CP12_STRDI|nr:hypothetical protein Sdia_25690 [Streptomyces diastaticus subsp. diastaticus]GGU47473.1 hypothetical protein GCM10015534_57470 [Streptomyces diastaticus subsp. diastaticus]